MSNLNDFVIENGVLKKYKGKDSEVTIPNGVKKIGEWAFSGCKKLTIHGPKGSYAEKYGKSIQYSFCS